MKYDIANSESDRVSLIEAVRDPKRSRVLLAQSDLPDHVLFYIANQADRVSSSVLVMVAEHPAAEDETQRLAWGSAVRLHRNQVLIPLGLSKRAHSATLEEVVGGELSHYAAGRVPHEIGQQFLIFAATNPHTPETALARLGAAPDLRIRAGVAANPRTPMATLGHLANDMAMEVRRAVATNPVIGLAVMRRLSCDILDVRMRLVENSAAFLRQPHGATLVLRDLSEDENRYVSGMAKSQLGTVEMLAAEVAAEDADVETEDLEIVGSELSREVRGRPSPISRDGDVIELREQTDRSSLVRTPHPYVDDVMGKINGERRPDRLFEIFQAGALEVEERVFGNLPTDEQSRTFLDAFPAPSMMERQADAVAEALKQTTPASPADMPPLPSLPPSLPSASADPDALPPLSLPEAGGPTR